MPENFSSMSAYDFSYLQKIGIAGENKSIINKDVSTTSEKSEKKVDDDDKEKNKVIVAPKEDRKDVRPPPEQPKNENVNAVKTRMIYMEGLQYTYTYEEKATIVDARTVGEDKILLLDQSIFHAQGGGQPSDVGVIEGEGFTCAVKMVKQDKDSGEVFHFVETAAADLGSLKGKAVNLKIDKEVRNSAARLHSAGHLLDAAVQDCGWTWKPGKGYHFPDGPYVEYIVDDKKPIIDAAEDHRAKLEVACARLIDAGGLITMGQKNNVRTIDVCGVGTHCGGTHVPELKDIGIVKVKKIKAAKANIRVTYEVN